MTDVDDDEFAALEAYARREGLMWTDRPAVARRTVEVAPDQSVSALVWGEGDPEAVLLHGGAQNAHTWDSVALALGRPLVAVDLPGHGHSSWRDDRNYWPHATAPAVATAIAELAPRARVVVGMSLGGLTAIRLAGIRPDLVRRLVVVDVTPGSMARFDTITDRGPIALTMGPREFPSFDDMLTAVAATLPGRSRDSLRPAVRNNARPGPDGAWSWRYDQMAYDDDDRRQLAALWTDVASLAVPTMVVRGGRSAHVHDDDVAQWEHKQPSVRIELVPGAGHAVQSDRPLVLAGLIAEFLG